MNKRILLLPLPFMFAMCDLGPTPLKLGEAPHVDAQAELTLPLNVTKAFSPTGYFYNVWAPADTTFTQVDPEKWNNFLAYQSIFQHPACADRVSMAELVKQDTTLPAYIQPSLFFQEFACNEFTYAPISKDDLYGGVFWLRGNNFGNHPGVKVKGGAKHVKFWARSLTGKATVKFGVGVNNSSTLKPWYYFSPNVDDWGNLFPIMTPEYAKGKIKDPAGVLVDSVYVKDSLPEGASTSDIINLTDKWTLYNLDLGVLYAFNVHPIKVKTPEGKDTTEYVPFDSLPDHNLIGAFYWAIDATFISDSSQVTDPIRLPDGTRKSVRYGSSTILIDGIRYEE